MNLAKKTFIYNIHALFFFLFKREQEERVLYFSFFVKYMHFSFFIKCMYFSFFIKYITFFNLKRCLLNKFGNILTYQGGCMEVYIVPMVLIELHG